MTEKATMTLRELRTADPKAFQRKYEKWHEHALDSEWWDSVYEVFTEDMEPLGLRVDKIFFSLAYSQGAYAAVTGRLDMHKWMLAAGYGESHLALCLDAKEYGGYWSVSSRSSNIALGDANYEPGNTYPAGIFSELPQGAWDELVRVQYESEDWGALATAWVRAKCEELYRMLRDEYEYLTSEDSFIEWSEANEV